MLAAKKSIMAAASNLQLVAAWLKKKQSRSLQKIAAFQQPNIFCKNAVYLVYKKSCFYSIKAANQLELF